MTINMHGNADIKAEGKLNSRHCKAVICLETGEVFTSVADAAWHFEVHAQNMSTHLVGKRKHIKGYHFCYLSKATESLDAIVTRLREASTDAEDARKWREHLRKQEEARKAEEARIEAERRAKEQHEAALEKARNKVARCEAVRDRIAAQLAKADQRLMDAQIELEALEDLEGNDFGKEEVA
jgi:septal ring factor EnvC (AmiA/AmiB activator)